MVNCYAEPDMVHTTLQKVTVFLIEYAKAFKGAGANGIVIAEPAAGLLSPALNEAFSVPYVRQLVQAVQDEHFAVIYHNCGNTIPLLPAIETIGADGYHFGNAIDLEEVLKLFPAHLPVFGNVDPAGQFRNGTPESIREATLALLMRCSQYPNFLLSSGCDIPPASSWENIDSFFAAGKEFYS